jgi:class 3 adenylate cyclase
VTALFADIKGSTELMEDLDPEEARAIIDPALKLMIDAAHRYDGYVVQSTGDGVFALFGAWRLWVFSLTAIEPTGAAVCIREARLVVCPIGVYST